MAGLILASYLLGSAPTAYVLVRLLRGQDIRSLGSGNIGAANATRVLGIRWGLAVFAADAVKGCVPSLVAHALGWRSSPELLLLPCAAFLGHIFPVYLRFKGGKGVATAFGAALPLDPISALASAGLFLALVKLTRVTSVASLTASLLLPILVGVRTGTGWLLALCCFMTTVIFIAHQGNIRRLFSGTERRF
jgi:glycerol-3-phosphate acyltransferase PlsY